MAENILDERCVYSTIETAKLLGVGHNRVRTWVREGLLRSLPGRNFRIPGRAIADFLTSGGFHEPR
jgi:excisionase family DNA binding protein